MRDNIQHRIIASTDVTVKVGWGLIPFDDSEEANLWPYESEEVKNKMNISFCSLLAVPRIRTCFGSRSFSVAAPTTWNSLPLHSRNSSSIFGFRRQLETFLYK